MKIFRTKLGLSEYLANLKSNHKVIGFVPTMGALHTGHLELIKIARSQSDFTVCSIFVNPTQFNDPKDLEKYPRPIEGDIEKLKAIKCDVLFLPEVEEMYVKNEKWHIDLGELENVLEGKFRPKHYQGVTQIVKKLFNIIEPDLAFFGQKDFQQFRIIDKMVKLLKLHVKLIMCPIVREKDGLAMSSRNIHLSAEQHEQALALFKSLNIAKDNFNSKSIARLLTNSVAFLKNSPGINLEYFEICNAVTLKPTVSKHTKNLVALVAAKVGNIRLIDNLILK